MCGMRFGLDFGRIEEANKCENECDIHLEVFQSGCALARVKHTMIRGIHLTA